jgi:hypothetical protein
MEIQLYPEEYLKVLRCFPAGYQVAILGTERYPGSIRPRSRGVRSFVAFNGMQPNGWEVKPFATEEEAVAAMNSLKVVHTDSPRGIEIPAVDQVVGGHPVKQAIFNG